MDMPIENRMPQMTGVSVDQTALDAGEKPGVANQSLLTGPALTVVLTSGGPNGPTVPERTAVLLSIMNAQYKTLCAIVKNLGVSERERELRERHKEELKKKMLELERRKDITEQELINAANTFIAAEDRALLDARMEENMLKG